MEMHLPFFVLRKHSSAEISPTNTHDHFRRWEDISFLRLPSRGMKPLEVYGIHPAQFSFVISGRNDQHWTGYCFDTQPDNESLSEVVCNEELQVDPIATTSSEQVLADAPIRDPRSYFLRVLETRASEICNEWERVVEEVARGISQYVSKTTFSH